MEIKIGDKVLTLNTKLIVTKNIKLRMKKSFNTILQNIANMDIEDYINLLYCGIDSKEMSFDEFETLVYENIGIMELYEIVTNFIKQLQYPGLSIEEIDKKLEEKNLQAQKLNHQI